MNRAFSGLWPDEAAALKTLGEEAAAIAVPPKQLDQITAPATEDEDMTREWIGGEFLLNDRGQTVEATAHVGHAGGQPNAVPLGRLIIVRAVSSVPFARHPGQRGPGPKVELVGTGSQCTHLPITENPVEILG